MRHESCREVSAAQVGTPGQNLLIGPQTPQTPPTALYLMQIKGTVLPLFSTESGGCPGTRPRKYRAPQLCLIWPCEEGACRAQQVRDPSESPLCPCPGCCSVSECRSCGLSGYFWFTQRPSRLLQPRTLAQPSCIFYSSRCWEEAALAKWG